MTIEIAASRLNGSTGRLFLDAIIRNPIDFRAKKRLAVDRRSTRGRPPGADFNWNADYLSRVMKWTRISSVFNLLYK
ncbi:MAG TPA: hypothetical protein VM008_15350 [Phycisphaerae bacterium]|nr:hypothetical protein [Phycisphaerae bacterium]